MTFNVLHEYKSEIFGGGDNKSHAIIHVRIFLGKLLVYELVLSSSVQFKLLLIFESCVQQLVIDFNFVISWLI